MNECLSKERVPVSFFIIVSYNRAGRSVVIEIFVRACACVSRNSERICSLNSK